MNLKKTLQSVISKYSQQDLIDGNKFITYLRNEIKDDEEFIQLLIIQYIYAFYGNLYKTFSSHKDDLEYLNQSISSLVELLEKDRIYASIYSYPIYCILDVLGIQVDQVKYIDLRNQKKKMLTHQDVGYGLNEEDHGSFVIQKDTLVKYTGNSPIVFVPNKIINIGPKCFENHKEIKLIILSKNLQTIGEEAFRDCSHLITLYMPKTLNILQKGAFINCHSLYDIRLNRNIKILAESVFENCSNLRRIYDISPTSIASRALFGCSQLMDLDSILSKTQEFGFESLAQCNFTHLQLNNPSTHISHYFSKVTFSHSIKCVATDNGSHIEYYVPNTLKQITIHNGSIISYMFDGLQLDKIVLSNTVDVIHNHAFYGLITNEIVILNDNIRIEPHVFQDIKNCQISFSSYDAGYVDGAYLVIKNRLVQMIDSTIKEVTIKKNFEHIDHSVFDDCIQLESAIVEDGDRFDSMHSIFGKSLPRIKKLDIHLSTIKNGYFSGMNHLENLVIDGEPQSIGSFSFENCHMLKEIDIPSSIININDYAFSNCSNLQSISFSDRIEHIGYAVFNGCSSLNHLSLPSAIKGKSPIGSLFGIEPYENSFPINQMISSEISHTYYLPYSLKKVELTKGFITDGMFSNLVGMDIIIKNYQGNIGAFSFFQCDSIREMIVESSTRVLGDYAFYGCRNLTSFKSNNNTHTFGKYVLANCLSLKYIYLGGIKNFNKEIIEDTDGLASLTFSDKSPYKIHESFVIDSRNQQVVHVLSYRQNNHLLVPTFVQSLADSLFKDNQALELIDLSQSNVTHISKQAFEGCINLHTVKLNDHVKSIDQYAFQNCRRLLNINLPQSLMYIHEEAFMKCKSLRNIYLPDELLWIGSRAFYKMHPSLHIYEGIMQNKQFFDKRWNKRSLFGNFRIYSTIFKEDHMRQSRNKIRFILSSISIIGLILSLIMGSIFLYRYSSIAGDIVIPINEVQSLITFFSQTDYRVNFAFLIVSLVSLTLSLISTTILIYIINKEYMTDFYAENKKTELLTNSIKELAILRERKLITDDEFLRRKDALVKAGDRR